MNKNKVCIGVIMLIVALLIFGCSTTKIRVYDKSVPIRETAELVLFPGDHLTSVNGVRFRGNSRGGGLFSTLKKLIIKLPAGQHDLVFHVSYETVLGNRVTSHTASDLRITYNFEAGRRYMASTSTASRNHVTINISDITPEITDGLLTVTGLDDYNGKYISFSHQGATAGYREKKKNQLFGVKIENGIAEIPVFTWHFDGQYGNFSLTVEGDRNVIVQSGLQSNFYISDEEIFDYRLVIRGRQIPNGNKYVSPYQITWVNGKGSIDFTELQK